MNGRGGLKVPAPPADEVCMSAHRIPAVTAVTIADMQRGQHDAALVQYCNGDLDVIPSLSDEPVEYPTVVLRDDARTWAETLVGRARKAAENAGASTHLQTLRKAAGLAATAVLREHADAEDAAAAAVRPRVVVPTPPAPAVLLPMQRPEPQTLAEWERLLDALDLLDRMGLQVVPV